MSDWGLTAFYYDYEMTGRREKILPVKGLISKAYAYPGVTGMILHAYYGVRYFWDRRENQMFDFDQKRSHSCHLTDRMAVNSI